MRSKNKRLFALLLAAILLFALAGCAAGGSEKKTVTVTVVHGDGTQKEFTLRTAADTLGGAVNEEEGLVQGEEGPYGLYILTVDGETADEAQQQWWGVTQDGADVMTGIDSIEIADGDHYELTLHTGW